MNGSLPVNKFSLKNFLIGIFMVFIGIYGLIIIVPILVTSLRQNVQNSVEDEVVKNAYWDFDVNSEKNTSMAFESVEEEFSDLSNPSRIPYFSGIPDPIKSGIWVLDIEEYKFVRVIGVVTGVYGNQVELLALGHTFIVKIDDTTVQSSYIDKTEIHNIFNLVSEGDYLLVTGPMYDSKVSINFTASDAMLIL